MRFLWHNRSVLISFALFVVALAWVGAQRLRTPATDSSAVAACRPAQVAQEQRRSASTAEIITYYQERIKRCETDQLAYSQLALAYLQRARESGDASYYAKAEEVIAEAQRRDHADVLVLEAQSMLALSRHQFRSALALAEQALALNPNRPETYGLIGDAQVELGRYSEAVAAVQRMVDLRPNLSSFSRVSYLRELHGDIPGAIAAMQQAIEATGPNAESTAWTVVQLGHLYFKAGALVDAEREYRRALVLLPDYIHALAGLAQVETARGKYDVARELYLRVVNRTPLPEYVIALGELELASGNSEQAARQFKLVEAIDSLQRANGMLTDLEMALFLANHGDPQRAVERARAAYTERPGIYAADALAWALSQSGEQTEAQRYMDEVLRLGTQDSQLFFHAGMIAYRRGDLAGARHWMQEALRLNPFFSPIHADTARHLLREIDRQQ